MTSFYTSLIIIVAILFVIAVFSGICYLFIWIDRGIDWTGTGIDDDEKKILNDSGTHS